MSEEGHKEAKAAPPQKEPKPVKNLPACGFMVTGTKKGGLPIAIDKRAKGKKVTVISNVQGSAKSLLSSLSSLLGVGGTMRQESSGIHWTVEIQGDQTERVSAALVQLGCLRGIIKDDMTKAKKKVVVEATRVCAYDKFLRKKGEGPNVLDAESEYVDGSFLRSAECFKWHGFWPYCRGNCDPTMDLSDVWAESLHSCHECNLPSVKRSADRMNLPEINICLRNMGMLAEVGAAVKEAKTLQKEVKTPQKNCSANFDQLPGRSIDDYRKAALTPGAKLLEWESSKKMTRAERVRARSQSASASKRAKSVGAEQSDASATGRGGLKVALSVKKRATDLPIKAGRFRCGLCGAEFGLRRTLAMHSARMHQVGMYESSCAAASAPDQSRIPGYAPGPSRSPSIPRIPQGVGAAHRSSVVKRESPPSRSTARSNAPPAVAIKPAQPQKAPSEHVWASLLRSSRPLKDRGQDDNAVNLDWSGEPSLRRSASSLSNHVQESSSPMAECPWCGLECRVEDIEAHVAQCMPEEDELDPAPSSARQIGSQHLQECSSDKELGPAFTPSVLAGDDLRRVKESWSPSGKGMENMLKVSKGDEVALDWEQPVEEGGYWAYVYLVSEDAYGYLPKKMLEVINSRREEAESKPLKKPQAYDKSETATQKDDWVSTICLLEEAENLRKASEKSQKTAQKKQAGSQKTPDEDCKSAQKKNWNSTPEPQKPFHSAEEFTASAPSKPFHSAKEDSANNMDFPEEWLETVLDLGFSEFQSLAFWSAFENLRASGENLERAFLNAIEIGLAAEEAHPAMTQSQKGMQAADNASFVEVLKAADNGSFADVLKVSNTSSTRASSTTNTPSTNTSSIKANKTVLTSTESTRPSLATSTSSASSKPVDPSLSRCFKLNGKLCTGPCMFCRRVGAGKRNQEEPPSLSSPLEPPRLSLQSGYQEMFPEPIKAQPDWQDSLECPVCQKRWPSGSIRMVDFEAHVNSCIAKSHSKAPSRPPQECQQSQAEEGFNDEIRRWALDEIKTLLDRFCFMKETDPTIVLSVLEACGASRYQMEAEACELMHSNEPVKDFARKLWDCRVAGSLQPIVDEACRRGGKVGGKGNAGAARGSGTRRGRWR